MALLVFFSGFARTSFISTDFAPGRGIVGVAHRIGFISAGTGIVMSFFRTLRC